MNDGGPAFPVLSDREYERVNGGSVHALDCDDTGMSLRDWFAGQAITGLCACIPRFSENKTNFDEAGRRLVELAWAIADAMLAERQKRLDLDGNKAGG